MIRDDIKTALVTAMKGGDKQTTAAIRLIQSSIKNRDIEARAPQSREGKAPADDDTLVVEVLQQDGEAAPRVDRDVCEGQPPGTGRCRGRTRWR